MLCPCRPLPDVLEPPSMIREGQKPIEQTLKCAEYMKVKWRRADKKELCAESVLCLPNIDETQI